jgi:Hint module
MFTHKMAGGVHDFVQLTTSTGATISVTSGHYMPIDGALVAASNVAVGDVLQLGDGTLDEVASVAAVQGSGLYNPQTLHGDIVVNGVVASTYTTAVAPSFAHAVLAPFRTLSAVLGMDFTFLESGGGVLEVMAPRGGLSS